MAASKPLGLTIEVHAVLRLTDTSEFESHHDQWDNQTMLYFSFVGSYSGGIKISGKWVRVSDLNRIDKSGWERIKPSDTVRNQIREQKSVRADVLFPTRKIA